MATTLPAIFNEVESKIIEVRNQKILLDSDIARLYGVETRDINKAVKNNPDKFPAGYIFDLTKDEKTEVVENFHHLTKLKFSPQLPKAFTEKGLYMLATILKSKRATQTTLAIIETFSRINTLAQNLKVLSQAKDENQKQEMIKKSGSIISQILREDLMLDESETSIELNLAVIKLKHTIKKKKKTNK
ncbi:MAG: ORF6N domain-containing protein [Bacteroidia bacterium]